MRIPIYEQEVGRQEGQAPSAPNLSAPPPAAFGTGVAEQVERLGQTAENVSGVLANHMLEMDRQRQRADAIRQSTDFRSAMQDLIFSPEPIEKTDSATGQAVSVPKGVFNRMGYQAQGATQELDQQFSGLRKAAVDSVQSSYQKQLLGELIDNHYNNLRERVANHEGTQVRQGNIATTLQHLDQSAAFAADFSQDPSAAAKEIDKNHGLQYAMATENGMDKANLVKDMERRDQDWMVQAVAPLINPSPGQALGYLESVNKEGVISPATYNKLKEHILTESKKTEILEKYQKDQNYEGNMRQAMLDMFDGNLSLSEAQRRYRSDMLSKSDYDLLEAKMIKPDYALLRDPGFLFSDPGLFSDIRQAQLSQSKSPGEIDRMVAQGYLDKKISADDSKYLTKINTRRLPDPRDTQINAQANSVRDFGNRYFATHVGDYLPSFADSLPGADVELKKNQTAKESDAMVSDFLRQVDKENATGPRIQEIAHDVIKTHAQKTFPEIGRLSDIPHVVVTIDGKVKRLLNPDQATKLKGRYKVVPAAAQDADQQ